MGGKHYARRSAEAWHYAAVADGSLLGPLPTDPCPLCADLAPGELAALRRVTDIGSSCPECGVPLGEGVPGDL